MNTHTGTFQNSPSDVLLAGLVTKRPGAVTAPRHALRASFCNGTQQVAARCYDYRTAAANPASLAEALRDWFFTDVALYLDLTPLTARASAYLTDFHYQVGDTVYEIRAPQLVETDGTLGTLQPDRTTSILLILPMARRGEPFTLHFGGDSVEVTLPAQTNAAEPRVSPPAPSGTAPSESASNGTDPRRLIVHGLRAPNRLKRALWSAGMLTVAWPSPDPTTGDDASEEPAAGKSPHDPEVQDHSA